MLWQSSEPNTSAHSTALVQQTVVEFGAGTESSIQLLRYRISRERLTGVRPEVVKSSDAKQGTVCAVKTLGAKFTNILLQEG